jgi:hypothetical protein
MIHRKSLLPSLGLLAALTGCGSAPPPPPSEPVKTVIDDQLRTMDKAAATEDQILDQAKAQSEQIDQQSN